MGNAQANKDIPEDIVTSLFSACEQKDLSKLQSVFSKLKKKQHSTALSLKDKLGRIPLLVCVYQDFVEGVKFLLEKGSAVHAGDHKLNGPIHVACAQGNLEIVKLLLSKDSRTVVQATNGLGRSALHISVESKQFECFREVLQYCTQDEINLECGGRANPVTPLSLAVENDADDFVSLLCEQKVKLRTECTNSQKLTPLHMCCKKGNEKLLKMLLDKGANVNVTSSDASTPLHLAAKHGHSSCCKLLLDQKDIVIDCRDTEGNTPLMYAARNNMLEVVKLMLDRCSFKSQLLLGRNKKGESVLEFISKQTNDSQKEEESESSIADYLKKEMSLCSTSSEEKHRLVKFQICSDLHIEFFKNEVPDILEPGCDYLCLLGDIGLAKEEAYREFLLKQAKLYKKVFVLAGNHEYYHTTLPAALETMKKICSESDSLVFMNKTSVLVDGIRVLGTTLWSEIPQKDYEEIQMSLSDFRVVKMSDAEGDLFNPTEFNKMHAEERDWLKSEIAKAKENKEPVLVLTHHSPVKDCGCSDPQYFGGVSQAAFCTDLRSMLGAPVDVWAYGHTHWYHDMTINGTRVISNPRGYVTATSFDPKLVLELKAPL